MVLPRRKIFLFLSSKRRTSVSSYSPERMKKTYDNEKASSNRTRATTACACKLCTREPQSHSKRARPQPSLCERAAITQQTCSSPTELVRESRNHTANVLVPNRACAREPQTHNKRARPNRACAREPQSHNKRARPQPSFSSTHIRIGCGVFPGSGTDLHLV